jgi:PAS domain-containing protein
MNAPLMSASSQISLSMGAWLIQSRKRSSLKFSSQGQKHDALQGSYLEADQSDRFEPTSLDQELLQTMLEAMPQGVMLFSQVSELIYCNAKAEELCERLREPDESLEGLPVALVELCQRFLQEEGVIDRFLVMEYRENSGGVIRAQVNWMRLSGSPHPCFLMLIEDCQAVLFEEWLLEQKKYDLTDREAEVWFLIRQNYTYQEVSDALEISMNTVKTHVKNVNAKRKRLAGRRKIWYSR